MSNTLVLSPAERVAYSKTLIKDYRDYIHKSTKRTPSQIIDVIYLGRKDWFDVLSTDDTTYFNKLFERISLSMDIDPHWDVSIENQLNASDVFNGFLRRMGKTSTDMRRDTSFVTKILGEELGKAFKIKSDAYSILKAVSSDPQLRAVGKRLTKELLKMGYNL